MAEENPEDVERRLDEWLPRPWLLCVGEWIEEESGSLQAMRVQQEIQMRAIQPVKAGQLLSTRDVEPSPCAPTYAMSHRFRWNDESGVMQCACGVDTSGAWGQDEWSCKVFAPTISGDALSLDGMVWSWYSELTERNGGHGSVRWSENHIDPVEAERQRCERLGVEWVGPDVQTVAPKGISYADIRAEQMKRQRIENLALIYDEERAGAGLKRISVGVPYDGGIVRLGCELREADGVTPR